MAALVSEARRAAQALGQIHYGPTEAERNAVLRRRSLYVAQDLKAGDILNSTNLAVSAQGLVFLKYYDNLLGKSVNQEVKKGNPMSWDFIG